MQDRNRADVRRAAWGWWGLAAAVLGIVANVVADDQRSLSEAQRGAGAAVVDELDRTVYHVGVVAGLLAFACLLLVAAGWRRWTEESGQTSLAALTIAPALTVSAAALLVGYGFRGGLAEYLAGGINDDNFPNEGLYVFFMINDKAPWFGWWGVVAAAAACGWLAFTFRVLPLWLGVVSALAVAVPVVIMAVSGSVALAGLTGPVWLGVASLVVALRGLPVDRATSSSQGMTRGRAGGTAAGAAD